MAAEPGTGIITDEELTRASGQENSDPAVAGDFLDAEAATGDIVPGRTADAGDLSWYGDSAYGTGDLRDAIGKAGHRAVIKPRPVQAPVEGGFTADDFAVDEQAGTVTRPAGVTRAIPRPGTSSSAPPAARARCAPAAPPPSPAGP